MWVLEFYETETGKLFGGGSYWDTFLRAKDEVKVNFENHTIRYETQGPWQVTIPVQADNVPSPLAGRIRNFPTIEHYEFYKQARALIPGAEPFVSNRIERGDTVEQMRERLGEIIATEHLIDTDTWGL